MEYCFITGATGYLGKAIASELAKSGKNLFLTATNLERLEELKKSLNGTYSGVYIEIFAANLASESDRERLFEYAKKFTFCELYNVAGIDNQMPFLEYSEELLIRQIRVNFEGAASVTLFALKHSNFLKVANISSVSGEVPLAYFQIYSATKSALTFFSLALGEEIRGKGTVTAIIAGGIYTRDDVKKYIAGEGFYGRLAAKTPEYVATKCIKATKKSKKKYVVGGLNRLTLFVGKLVPRTLKMKFMARRLKTTRKNFY